MPTKRQMVKRDESVSQETREHLSKAVKDQAVSPGTDAHHVTRPGQWRPHDSHTQVQSPRGLKAGKKFSDRPFYWDGPGGTSRG